MPISDAQRLERFPELKDRFEGISGFNGVPNKNESYLLLSRFDGNLKEGIVELIDLTNFKVLHTWNPDINKINNLVDTQDEFKYLNRDKNNSRATLNHPYLNKNGNLVFHFYTPLRIIDKCSELVFQNTSNTFHHSIEADIDGNIWVPAHLYPQTLPVEKIDRTINIDGSLNFYDDALVKLSNDGKVLFEKSLTQIFIENGMEYLLFANGGSFNRDPLHLNDIQPVNYDSEYWKKGDVFLSMRNLSMILLYRPSSNKIIWKGTGPFFYQHDVDILDNSKISIFNNNTKNLLNEDIVDGYNEVIIYDFKSQKYSNYMQNSLNVNEVKTFMEGTSQILDNGDLFIEESNYYRTLYFNSDGSLRWTHINRADDDSSRLLGQDFIH